MQLLRKTQVRRPGYEMRSLYDVFAAIRDDESDHVDTMISCLDSNFAVRSPTLK